MPRWLYQGKADVASTQQEAPPVDKWQPVFPPLRKVQFALSAAILAGSLFMGDIPRAENITLDKWQPRYVDQFPILKASLPRSIQSGSFFLGDVPRAETITLDKWVPIRPDSTFLHPAIRGFRQPETPFLWTPPPVEIVTIDKWLGRYPDLLFSKVSFSRSINAGALFLGDIPRPETVLLEKWAGSFPVQLFQKGILIRAIQSGSFFFGDAPRAENITLDKWVGSYPEFLPPNLSRLRLGNAGMPQTWTPWGEALTTYAANFIVQGKTLFFRAGEKVLSFEAIAKLLRFMAK